MGRIDSKVLFLTTSPRTPAKMIPEISLLNQHFQGEKWNTGTQAAYMRILKEENFFQGDGEKDPAFSARDRINRAPQTLGFVVLKPHIKLTDAGLALTSQKRTDEIFLRQLLKFQIPSPYHRLSEKAAQFCVKPYLEIFRLIRHFGTLQFDELKMFALQLTDYRDFWKIVRKIETFRRAKAKKKGSYKGFATEYFEKELQKIYSDELSTGNIKTRESRLSSKKKFLQTKGNNMRDYADACFRYLRATGMISVSHVGKSLSITEGKTADVDFFLQNTDREPCFVETDQEYINYLGNAALPALLTDDRNRLLRKMREDFPTVQFDETAETETLKNLYADLLDQRRENLLEAQVRELKDYKLYDDIQETYQKISEKAVLDAPLMLEWNTWRAMTMLDGGNVKANLKFDDLGKPLSTAQGNMADIVCDYGDFGLCVEVTLSSGHTQFVMEGEPVARHLGQLKKETGKNTYCLLIAPHMNKSCVSFFYVLHKTYVIEYGGHATIIPLPLSVFRKMLEASRKADYVPQPNHVRKFFEYCEKVAETSENEEVWYANIEEKASNWLEQ
ncbi:MAG: AlwI family type II restriction endonuclease [Prevotellaceae bacterium]|nr:AlwI family type II restriction endonuclease [Prevotellaceae bacterium]